MYQGDGSERTPAITFVHKKRSTRHSNSIISHIAFSIEAKLIALRAIKLV